MNGGPRVVFVPVLIALGLLGYVIFLLGAATHPASQKGRECRLVILVRAVDLEGSGGVAQEMAPNRINCRDVRRMEGNWGQP